MFDFLESSGASPVSRVEGALVSLLERQAAVPVDAGSPGAGARALLLDVHRPTRRRRRTLLYPTTHGSGTTPHAAADGTPDTIPDPACTDGQPAADPTGSTAAGGEVREPEWVANNPLADHLERGVEVLHEAREADREMSRQAARRARQLCAFARHRPADLFDRPAGERGALSSTARAARPAVLTDVSEWAVHEVSTAFDISRTAANGQLVQSVTLVELLPATLAGLGEARLSPAHAAVMVEVVGPIENDDIRATAETRLLDRLGRKTPPELKAAARRTVLRLDAKAAADRMVRAVRDRHVRLADLGDGMAALTAVLTGPVGQACLRTLEALVAETRTDDDERTHAQRMADCLADLILRPGQSELPAVQIALTVVASADTLRGGDEPGEIDGMLVPADLVRELAYAFGLLARPVPSNGQSAARGATTAPESESPEPESPRPEDPEPECLEPENPEPESPEPESPASQDDGGAAGSGMSGWLARQRAEITARQQRALVDASIGADAAVRDGRWTDGEPRDLLDLAALLTRRTVSGTALAHRPHIAVVDKLRGTLVALTDAAAISRCEALGPPPDTDGYRPGAALDRFVRLRDRRCRFPGCRQKPRKCDLDHQRPWPGGQTTHSNLCCLCETHHRLKHQAPGWEITAIDDHGGLAFRAPSGEVTVTHPPTFGTDDDLPPF